LVSPPLEPGKAYYYVLKARVVRGGKTVTTSREVMVRAGQASEVYLDVPAARVASK
jgi:uncharacterized protein (TIGR03000 family)